MKITIRPAPHSKGCAIDGRNSCDLYQNHQDQCALKCTKDMCCEMKHCWAVGEKLRDILIARGHEVRMADEKYRKGWPESKASQHTKAAMAELMAWKPDLHIAIHTNAAGASVMGVRIGYPDIAYNSGETERVANSKRLAELVAQHNARVYHTPSNVKTTTYNFSELNSPTCPAIYIEGCYANTNKKDAEWWHDNTDEIATSYADGIEAWVRSDDEEASFVAYKATVKTKTGGGASIWSDNKKSKRVALVADGETLTVTGGYDTKGFAPVEYKSYKGVFDSQYLVRVETENVVPTGKAENVLLDALVEIRKLADEAISAFQK